MASWASCLARSALASSIWSALMAVSARILISLAEMSAKPPPMVTSLSSDPWGVMTVRIPGLIWVNRLMCPGRTVISPSVPGRVTERAGSSRRTRSWVMSLRVRVGFDIVSRNN